MTAHLRLPSSEAQSPGADPSADPGTPQVQPGHEHQRGEMSRERMVVIVCENDKSDCTLSGRKHSRVVIFCSW